jgi:hypothetical protein
MERVKTVLESDLGPSAKLLACALVASVPMTGIGLSAKSIQRHYDAARNFVDGLGALVPDTPPPKVREKADADAWLRAQEADLKQVNRGFSSDVWSARDPYRG